MRDRNSNDAALLRALSGASFGPTSRLVLPSGLELTGDEAELFIDAEQPSGDDEQL